MIVRKILWAVLATIAVSVSYAGDPIEIGTGRVVLKFASDGRPKSFKADNKELLNEQDPGPGFEIKGEWTVVKKNFTAPKGKLDIRVESKGPEPAPWLECQFFVKDTPMVVGERKE